DDERSDEKPGHELPPRRGSLVLAQHEGTPVTVLALLREELSDSAARAVFRTNRRTLPNPSSAADDAQVVLVVLVSHERLVEAAETIEARTRPAPEIYRLDRAFIRCV